ncbi:MAG: ABC transporter ATP-binding protein [Thermoplasmatota archaeon]
MDEEATTEPTNATSPVAQFVDVAKSYGGRLALAPLNLTIQKGCTGLLGPNGAGKTTLMRILMGVLPPDQGVVRVLGEEVRPGARSLRRRIGYMPEGRALFPGLDGVQAVAYAGQLCGLPRGDAMQRAHQVLDYVALGDERYRAVANYSTGMRQRLKLAQALVHDPELLILDEPTEGVDPEAREDLIQLIHDLEREQGLQIVLSTHLLHDVERLAGNAIVLHQGVVAASGPLSALRAAPASGYFVRANAPLDAVRDGLVKAGLSAHVEPPNVRVDSTDVVALLKALQGAGLTVRHLAPLGMTLEEAFAQAVSNA